MKIGPIQKAFNTIVRGLASQGWQRSGVRDWYNVFTCKYRCEDRKCAVGWLIPDEEYDDGYDLVGTPPEDLPFRNASSTQTRFIKECQRRHDGSPLPRIMLAEFKEIGRKYQLRWPKDVEDVC